MTIMCDKNSFILATMIGVRSRRTNPILWSGRTSLGRALENASATIDYFYLTPRDDPITDTTISFIVK